MVNLLEPGGVSFSAVKRKLNIYPTVKYEVLGGSLLPGLYCSKYSQGMAQMTAVSLRCEVG
jgi:hypothetical protein